MPQTEESPRRLSPSRVRKRWEKIRGIEDEDDDEYENDTPPDEQELVPSSSQLILPVRLGNNDLARRQRCCDRIFKPI